MMHASLFVLSHFKYCPIVIFERNHIRKAVYSVKSVSLASPGQALRR